MKIALTGPHSCGKSTVFRAIEHKYSGKKINFISYDGNRAPIDYGNMQKLKENPELELDLTNWMIADLIKREIEATNKYENVILDRCVIDQLVYPYVILGKELIPDAMKEYVKFWISTRPYDLVFLFPRNEQLLKEFGKKDKSVDFLREIDDGYINLINEYKINIVMLPNSQEEQINTIKKDLERVLK